MIFELRTFQSLPGRLPVVHRHLSEHTLPILEKHGIKVVGCWTYLFGGSSEQLLMLLAHEDMASRERNWDAFHGSPEWQTFRKEAEEKDGRVLDHSVAQILQATPYSPLA